MNTSQRKTLSKVVSYLVLSRDLVDQLKFNEEYSLGNIPESLLDTQRARTMEDAIDTFDSSIDTLNELVEDLQKFL